MYFYIMKINDFRVDLTDISATKEALTGTKKRLWSTSADSVNSLYLREEEDGE